MKYISRQLEPMIVAASREYPVVLVTGPRQVGKTTMLKKMMEGSQRTYVTLDDLSERDLAKNDPEMFLQLHKPPILIDEVQYAPELFPYIKMQVDNQQRQGDFWLTGSQVFPLMRGVSESLAGRVAVFSLTSFSQSELEQESAAPFMVEDRFLQLRKQSRKKADIYSIYERIFRGSMPAVISGNVTNRQVFYSSYLSTYIDRDVKELSNTIDSLKFRKFMVSVAARSGQMLNISSIVQDADINQKQAKDWLNILETLGIIFYLHPYSNNMLKRLVKAPKLYFYDTGLVCHLTKWSNAETLATGAMSGAILETYVVSEIAKSWISKGIEPSLYYFRNKDAKEIDLVIEHDGTINPIEIKRTSNPGKDMIKNFSVLKNSTTPQGPGAIVCLKQDLGAVDKNNYVVPVWMI